MSGKLPWYMARASGLVAWALLVASIVWGLGVATRLLRRRPAASRLLDMHRYLGALALAFVGVHVSAILLDTFVRFTPVDVLVPLASSWHPVAVAWGVASMYLLVAVELTSLARRRLAPRAWRQVHILS